LFIVLYIAVNTRPDISASVTILAQKVTKPTQEDWNKLKRILIPFQKKGKKGAKYARSYLEKI